MATAATLRPTDTIYRAPIPANYFCKSCGLEAHHWIMDCSALTIFHATKKLFEKANEMDYTVDEFSVCQS